MLTAARRGNRDQALAAELDMIDLWRAWRGERTTRAARLSERFTRRHRAAGMLTGIAWMVRGETAQAEDDYDTSIAHYRFALGQLGTPLYAFALYRTAQIAYDLEFDGVPYMYSWPSKGEKRAYLYDRDSADRARRYFREFIELVALKTKAKRIHIITHSLGTRPTLEALQQIAAAPGGTKNLKLGQIILAAPDIDRDVFKDIAGVITKAGRGTTLYAADNDRPLQLSRLLARGKPRAGEITKKAGPMIVKGVDTIDISDAGTDAFLSLHHATYADNTHVLADMRLLLRQGVHPPDKRFPIYQRKTIAAGTYWKYVKN